MTDFCKSLSKELNQNDVFLSEPQVERLFQHYQLLLQWNEVHNLTSIKGAGEAARYHYADSAIGISFLKEANPVLDAGSGAGFPGIVAAVMWPGVKVILVEASRKKCSFLNAAIMALGLKNASVVHGRIENQSAASLVLSRAAFSVDNLKLLIKPVAPGGAVALWLGQRDVEAVSTCLAALDFSIDHVYRYVLSGVSDRLICVARRST